MSATPAALFTASMASRSLETEEQFHILSVRKLFKLSTDTIKNNQMLHGANIKDWTNVISLSVQDN